MVFAPPSRPDLSRSTASMRRRALAGDRSREIVSCQESNFSTIWSSEKRGAGERVLSAAESPSHDRKAGVSVRIPWCWRFGYRPRTSRRPSSSDLDSRAGRSPT
jgi:hypothetical protein